MDFDKLLKVWKGWHDESTKEMKSYYERYVVLYNKKAKDMGTRIESFKVHRVHQLLQYTCLKRYQSIER